MTLFEYLAIAFSLVLSFAAMRVLAGVSFAIRRGRRYWVHVTFVGLQLSTTVLGFWVFWSFRGADWNLLGFLLALSGPGIIFFNACTLIPEDASSVESWRDYYYSVRRRYFLGLVCLGLVQSGMVTILLDTPWLHPIRAGHLATLLVGTTGASSASQWVHGGLAMGFLILHVIAVLGTLLQPGPVAP